MLLFEGSSASRSRHSIGFGLSTTVEKGPNLDLLHYRLLAAYSRCTVSFLGLEGIEGFVKLYDRSS